MKRTIFSLTLLTFLLSAESSYSQSTWTPQTSGTTAGLYSVTWTGSLLVAAGTGGIILTSPDGITWTPQTSGTTKRLFFVSWCGGQVIAAGESGTILTSPDGVTWTSRTSGTTRGLNNVTWNGTLFIAFGNFVNGFPPVILTSPDGVTWTTRYNSDTLWNLYSFAMNDSINVIVGIHSTYMGNVVLASSDGITWTKAAIEVGSGLYDVVWTGSNFVAVGHYCRIFTSPDGYAWTQQRWTYSGATGSYLSSIAGNGGMLVTAGTFNLSYIIVSSPDDGVTWTERSGGGGEIVKWLGNYFLTVGSGGIATSSDGITWIHRTSGSLNAINFTGNLYVAVGNGGTILTSPLDPTGVIPRNENTKSHKIFLKQSGSVFTYTLPSREFVELGIYSISGKKVALLEKGYKTAGEHNASFNASSLPLGTYVYRFRAGSFEKSGRVMVFKK